MPTRRLVWASLCRLHSNKTRLDRFRNCGSAMWAEASTDDVRLRANFCNDRWCQTCGRRRVAAIRHQMEHVLSGREARLVTLTIRHSPTPLVDQIKRLRRSFQELRRRPVWKKAVEGGACFVEVKIGRDNLWHPHLHVVTVGKWIDGVELGKTWHAITGDSYVVDISAKRGPDHVVSYVTKYVTKPVDHDVLRDPDRLDEAITALKSVRLMSTFGTWKKIKLRGEKPDADQTKWKPIGRVSSIMTSRDPANARFRDALLRKWPALSFMLTARQHADTS